MPCGICGELASTANNVAEKKELLGLVNDAIRKLVLGGVQSYTIGKRSLTRLNLNDLRALKRQLEDEITAANTPDCLMGNTRVSYFDRR